MPNGTIESHKSIQGQQRRLTIKTEIRQPRTMPIFLSNISSAKQEEDRCRNMGRPRARGGSFCVAMPKMRRSCSLPSNLKSDGKDLPKSRPLFWFRPRSNDQPKKKILFPSSGRSPISPTDSRLPEKNPLSSRIAEENRPSNRGSIFRCSLMREQSWSDILTDDESEADDLVGLSFLDDE